MKGYKMTRKDFEAVAKIVAIAGSENRGVLLVQARVACDILEQANPRFDRDRFCACVLRTRANIEDAIAKKGA